MNMKRKNALFICALAMALTVAALTRGSSTMVAQAQNKPREIAITAKRFTFEPAEVKLKKGETVVLKITSADVTHGIFVRPLKIDSDIPAGKTVEVTITPAVTGTFTAICDHFCGSGHGNMKMTFIVEE